MGTRRSKGASLSARAPADGFSQTVPEPFVAKYLDTPGTFVVPSAEARSAAMEIVGRTYDAANISAKFGIFDDWNAVTTSGFDPETQLWELINMRNEPVLKYSAGIMKELSLLIDSVDNGSDDSSDDSDADREKMDISQSEASASAESSDDENEDEDEDETAALEGSDDELEPGSPEVLSAESGDNDDEGGGDDDDESEGNANLATAKPSIVDDEFFSLAEVEAFADEGEEEEMRYRAILAGDYSKAPEDENEAESSDDDDESIDIFQDVGALDDEDDSDPDGDADGKRPDEMMYADFFKPPTGPKRGTGGTAGGKPAKRVKFAAGGTGPESESEDDEASPSSGRKTNLFEDEDDGSDKGDADGRSEFEKRQEKLQGMINKLEDEAVSGKHWTMIGEVGSNKRPKNSLLAEDLDFDHVQKAVPVITQEATVTLEDIIKRRILNEEWDDVVRKKDIQAKPFRPSKLVELNDKASKKSLAEEYEEEYMAQKTGDQFVPEDEVKLAESHKDIDSQLRNLFVQLDALSHFHFAPKPATADIEIRTNAPALQMEEKLP
ncbi:U3 snoRNP protein, partial [Coemansia biformis]